VKNHLACLYVVVLCWDRFHCVVLCCCVDVRYATFLRNSEPHNYEYSHCNSCHACLFLSYRRHYTVLSFCGPSYYGVPTCLKLRRCLPGRGERTVTFGPGKQTFRPRRSMRVQRPDQSLRRP
jgi:hypothetical protein